MREQTYVVLLILSYSVLASLHLVLLANLKFRRSFKAAFIVAMTSIYVASFFWTQGLLGWSAAIALPERFKLLAARVVEPDNFNKREGAIHLWVEELDKRNFPSGVPRGYLLPYSPDLASNVSDAQEEIKKGRPQGGRRSILDSGFGNQIPEGANVRAISKGGPAGGDPSGGGVLDPSALGGQSKFVDLIPLPPPLFPPKGAP